MKNTNKVKNLKTQAILSKHMKFLNLNILNFLGILYFFSQDLYCRVMRNINKTVYKFHFQIRFFATIPYSSICYRTVPDSRIC